MDLFTKNLWKTWDFLGNLMDLTLKIINPNYMWCSKNLGQPEDQKVDHNFAK